MSPPTSVSGNPRLHYRVEDQLGQAVLKDLGGENSKDAKDFKDFRDSNDSKGL